MNAPLPGNLRFDVQGLAQAIAHCNSNDALRCKFSLQNWETLAEYLQPFAMTDGQVLIRQGTTDRTIYLVESGTLSVHYEDEQSRVRMAMVGSGTVIGEGSFFSYQTRSATVQAASPCKLWSLTTLRFLEFAHRQSPLALELMMAMGGVMAKRLYNRSKRVAIT